MRVLGIWLLGVLPSLSVGAAARAADDQPLAVASREDSIGSRFQLGVRLGVGQLNVSFQGASIWGRTAPIELSTGFSLTRNVAVFGALYDAHMFGPISDYAHTDRLDLYGIGPGVSYRLEPSGMVFRWSLTVSQLHASGSDQFGPAKTSNWGITGRLSVGREWPVSPRWQLGFSGEVMFGRMHARPTAFEAGDYGYAARGAMLLLSGSVELPSRPSLGGPAPVVAPGAAAHVHEQFNLNASLGLAWLAAKSASFPSEVSGAGSSVGLSAGWAVARNLVAFGELYEAYASDPTFVSDHLADLELHGFGPGLRWYWMPFDVSVSAAFLLSRFSFHNYIPGDGRYGDHIISDWRLTGHASLGKEWWVSARWALGLAAELFYGHMPASLGGSVSSNTVKGGSLAFSATFD